MSTLEFLPWDSRFFGKRIGRVKLGAATAVDPERLHDELTRSSFDCVYIDLDATETGLFRELVRGARLTDVRVEMEADLSEPPAADPGEGVEEIVTWDRRDIDDAVALSRALSTWSRFAADPLFAAHAARLYREWVGHAFSGAHGALVRRDGGRIVGLLTYRLATDPAWIELLAVRDDRRGKGVGTALSRAFLAKARAAQRGRARVRTQLRNVGAIRTYERAGFRVAACTFMLHWWRSPS